MYSSYELIIIGRLLIGINCGLNAGLAPMYLAEISPMNLRGSVSINIMLKSNYSVLIISTENSLRAISFHKILILYLHRL